MADELEILKKLTYKTLSEAELLDIFYDNRDNYRVKLNLVMQPRFPEKYALDIISHLFAVDLLRVAKNKRVNPFVRRRVELEFSIKYQRFPLGEKLSYMRIAPPSLMEYFIEEHDRRVLEAMLKNPLCTENLVLRFIHRRSPR
ncbi:MAG: hypothetical protein GY765_38270, partial [bacterium]|nr:hypothetical protein [bacterium]